jgi:long-chain fatty acid transport protein
MRRLFFVILFLFLFSLFLSAQILLETQFSGPLGSGARAMGMGGAFIAIADDATATTWNPGGLGQIENVEITGVGSYYSFSRLDPAISQIDYFAGASYRTGDSFSYDLVGITVPIRPIPDTDFKIVLQYSYQRFLNFNIKSRTNAILFQHVYTNPDTGHKILEHGYFYNDEEFEGGLDGHSIGLGISLTSWLNLGVTANFWTNGFSGSAYVETYFTAEDTVTNETFEGFSQEVHINEGDFRGTSFNIGALVHATSNFNLGMVYKGEFTFTDKDKHGNDKGEVHYPQSVGFGLAYRPIDNLTLAVDFTYTDWSQGRAKYGEEEVFFPLMDLKYVESAEYPGQMQHDTNQLRLGAEYVFIADDLLIPIRMGAYFDKQYFADANDNIPVYFGLTAGAGLVWKGFVMDFAVVYVTGEFQSNTVASTNAQFDYTKVIASLIYRF